MPAVERWLRDAEWWQVFAISVALNVGAVGTSVGIWQLLVRSRGVKDLTRTVEPFDVVLVAGATVVNAASLIPAWWLWRRGTLELASPSFPRAVVEVAYLVATFETAMFLGHRILHWPPFYRWTHRTHHTANEQMCAVSLFVMNPIEPAGFAGVMLLMLLAWPVSLPAILGFFLVNLVIGTMAHRPVRASQPLTWADRVLGGAVLHQGHHDDEAINFGFFTPVWDVVLGTHRGRAGADRPTPVIGSN